MRDLSVVSKQIIKLIEIHVTARIQLNLTLYTGLNHLHASNEAMIRPDFVFVPAPWPCPRVFYLPVLSIDSLGILSSIQEQTGKRKRRTERPGGTRYNNNSVGLFTTLNINCGQCCLYLETLHSCNIVIVGVIIATVSELWIFQWLYNLYTGTVRLVFVVNCSISDHTIYTSFVARLVTVSGLWISFSGKSSIVIGTLTPPPHYKLCLIN